MLSPRKMLVGCGLRVQPSLGSWYLAAERDGGVTGGQSRECVLQPRRSITLISHNPQCDMNTDP